jgi:DNA-binding FadR family transcriptional regulator
MVRQVSSSPSLDGAFERLLGEIVSGAWGEGARLPAERELAERLGTSRPTLREALRRLGEWGLVTPRRGSGAVVRPRREWTIEVLPAYLSVGGGLGFPANGSEPGAAGSGLADPRGAAQLVRDLLALRRAVLVQVLRVVGPRVRPGTLGEARAHVAAAWAARADGAAFVREDFEAIRAVVEAAGFLPALWMLASLGGVYRAVAGSVGTAIGPPRDYPRALGAVLDLLEAGRADRAARSFDDYLDRHDRRLCAALGIA